MYFGYKCGAYGHVASKLYKWSPGGSPFCTPNGSKKNGGGAKGKRAHFLTVLTVGV